MSTDIMLRWMELQKQQMGDEFLCVNELEALGDNNPLKRPIFMVLKIKTTQPSNIPLLSPQGF